MSKLSIIQENGPALLLLLVVTVRGGSRPGRRQRRTAAAWHVSPVLGNCTHESPHTTTTNFYDAELTLEQRLRFVTPLWLRRLMTELTEPVTELGPTVAAQSWQSKTLLDARQHRFLSAVHRATPVISHGSLPKIPVWRTLFPPSTKRQKVLHDFTDQFVVRMVQSDGCVCVFGR